MEIARTSARWFGSRRLLVDSVLAAALGLIALTELSWESDGNPDYVEPGSGAALLLLLETLPLAVRRRAPLSVLAVVGTAVLVHDALGFPPGIGYLALAIAWYSAVVQVERPWPIGILALGVAGALAGPLVHKGALNSDELGTVVVVLAVPWLVGDLRRSRHAHAAELAVAEAEAERRREEATARAVANERARLARELHDVVSHAVSVTVVQAGAAGRVLRADPERAAGHVAAIEGVGRQAMDELRRLLGVLRSGDDGLEPLEPRPGVADLEHLAARLHEAGLPVELSREGEPLELPGSLDVSVYRIVQEALTNALKHAGPARARVVLRFGSNDVEVSVTDDGRGARALDGRAGHGLAGMRERVALLGGVLEAGNVGGGGFEVRARFPL